MQQFRRRLSSSFRTARPSPLWLKLQAEPDWLIQAPALGRICSGNANVPRFRSIGGRSFTILRLGAHWRMFLASPLSGNYLSGRFQNLLTIAVWKPLRSPVFPSGPQMAS